MEHHARFLVLSSRCNFVGLAKEGGCVLEVSAAHTTATPGVAHTSLATATHLGSPALPRKDRMGPLTGFLVLSLSQGEGTH